MMETLEILQNNLSEPSVFTSESFIAYRRKKTKKFNALFPRYAILGFFPKLYHWIRKNYPVTIYDFVHKPHPYYIFQVQGISVSYVFPGIGAPLASAILDETFALGAEICLFIGPAGVLNKAIPRGSLLLPTRAIRDEGTSFHYAPPARYAEPDADLLYYTKTLLEQSQHPYFEGITWSTDGVYRETGSKIQRLREEGCQFVDMEASALFSVAKFYGKKIAGLFLARDAVHEMGWDPLPTIAKATTRVVDLFHIGVQVFLHWEKQTIENPLKQKGCPK